VQLLCAKIPKAQKKTDSLTVFFALLGSGCVKAVSEHVGEIDPDRFLVLLEEIRAARENMGKYTRKTSQEYEDSTIVKTRDYRDSLIRLMQEVTSPDVDVVVKDVYVRHESFI